MMKVTEFPIKKTILAGLVLLLPSLLFAQLPAALEQRFARALAAYERGDMAGSEKLYRGLIKDYPKLPELYNNLAASLVAQGKSEQAIKVLQSGLRSHSAYASLYENLLNVNASMSREHYMQALVPVKQEKPRLKAQALTDLGQLYYAPPAPLQVAIKKSPTPVTVKQPATKPVKAAVVPAPTEIKLAQTNTDNLVADVPPIMDMESQVRASLLAWAKAWSQQNTKTYVNAYVRDYRPNNNISHKSWVKQRQQRLKRPKWIKVKLDDMQFFVLENGDVAVRLRQDYRSNSYRDIGRKELLLQRQDGRWKIKQENSL